MWCCYRALSPPFGVTSTGESPVVTVVQNESRVKLEARTPQFSSLGEKCISYPIECHGLAAR